MTSKLSLCIPVKDTEFFFVNCLSSIEKQNLQTSGLLQSDIEIVIINDQSSGADSDGRPLKKIVKDFTKRTDFKINYIVHTSYYSLMETRRELILESHSPYVMMIDSDDMLEPDCISILYNLITENDADIVQGNTQGFILENNENKILGNYRTGNVYNGLLENKMILHTWLSEGKLSAFLWAKIFRRDICLKAFENILFSDCSVTEDAVIFFFIALEAKKYVGTTENVYLYRRNSGLTSNREVKDLIRWEKICSTASGFSNLVLWINNKTEEDGISPISDDEMKGLQQLFLSRLHTSVLQLRNFVAPEIKDQAREMLYDYWGESFVLKMEEQVIAEEKKNQA